MLKDSILLAKDLELITEEGGLKLTEKGLQVPGRGVEVQGLGIHVLADRYVMVFIFIVISLALPVVTFLASRFLRPRKSTTMRGTASILISKYLRSRSDPGLKETTYECGEDPEGSAWIQFNVRFYVIALVFVIFDVEAAFLLPWAVVFRGMGDLAPVAFFEGVVFILILVVALAYVWRKGDLAWVRPEDRTPESGR